MGSMRTEELPFLVHMNLAFLDIILSDTHCHLIEKTHGIVSFISSSLHVSSTERRVSGRYLLESARRESQSRTRSGSSADASAC